MAIQAEFKFDKDAWDKIFSSIERKFKIMVSGGEYSQTLMDILSIWTFKDVIKHFAEESGPEGPWKAWSQVYAEHLSKIGMSGNRILQYTGRLRQSMVPGSPESGVRVTNAGFLFYNNAQTARGFPYAAAHNIGGSRLPKRQFMWVSEEALSSIAEQILRWVSTFDEG